MSVFVGVSQKDLRRHVLCSRAWLPHPWEATFLGEALAALVCRGSYLTGESF